MKKEVFVFKVTLLDNEIFNLLEEFDPSSNEFYELIKKQDFIQTIETQVISKFIKSDKIRGFYEFEIDELKRNVIKLITKTSDQFKDDIPLNSVYNLDIYYSYLKEDEPKKCNISVMFSKEIIEIDEPESILVQWEKERRERIEKEEKCRVRYQKIQEQERREKRRRELWLKKNLFEFCRNENNTKRSYKHIVCDVKNFQDLDYQEQKFCNKALETMLKDLGLFVYDGYYISNHRESPKLRVRIDISLKDILGKYLVEIQTHKYNYSWEVTIFEVTDTYQINFPVSNEIKDFVYKMYSMSDLERIML